MNVFKKTPKKIDYFSLLALFPLLLVFIWLSSGKTPKPVSCNHTAHPNHGTVEYLCSVDGEPFDTCIDEMIIEAFNRRDAQ